MTMRPILASTLFLGIVVAALLALALPMVAPIGPFYWDTLIYYDASARIAAGQMPSVDFMTPGGPLGYWLFHGVTRVFPDAQGLYAASWSILLVSGPLMAVVVHQAAKTSLLKAALLAGPFLFFSLMPFNVEQFYPYPGADGYGIYNRQPSQLLYALVAGLLFVEGQWIKALIVGVSLLALFLIKITGFLAALPLVALALSTGRLSLGGLLGALTLLAVCLGGLEVTTGVVSAYLSDIFALVALNDQRLLGALVKGAAIHVGIVPPLLLLIAVLVVMERAEFGAWLRALATASRRDAFRAACDSSAVWLCCALVCGVVFESQNWGGQAFIFLWPIAIRCLDGWPQWSGGRQLAIGGLAAAILLPPMVNIAGRALRSYAAQTHYVRLNAPGLGPLGAVGHRPETFRQAELFQRMTVDHADYFTAVADAGELPSYVFYTQPEFQIAWLSALSDGVAAIQASEARMGRRFETILSLNFVNPFPYLLSRGAPRHVSIGADPFRTVPAPDAATLAALRETDLVLWPHCPETIANRRIRQIYAKGLEDRTPVRLSECWTGLLKRGEPIFEAESRLGPIAGGNLSAASRPLSTAR